MEPTLLAGYPATSPTVPADSVARALTGEPNPHQRAGIAPGSATSPTNHTVSNDLTDEDTFTSRPKKSLAHLRAAE